MPLPLDSWRVWVPASSIPFLNQYKNREQYYQCALLSVAPTGVPAVCPLSGDFVSSSVLEICHYHLFRSLAESLAIQSLGGNQKLRPWLFVLYRKCKARQTEVHPPPTAYGWLLHRECLIFKSSFYLLVHQENYKYTQLPTITPCEDA